WVQTITQGEYEKKVYLDGLYRPFLIKEIDLSDQATVRYKSFTYNAQNLQTFGSYFSDNPSTGFGTSYTYDSLGRMVSEIRTSDNAKRTLEYLSGNTIETTDPNGNISSTSYLSYGFPSLKKPTLIVSPDSGAIMVDYNALDQPTPLSQGNVTGRRLYDEYQNLCKIIRPETGITTIHNNAQGQPTWRADGTNGSTTSCDYLAVPEEHKVLIEYDKQGKVVQERYPDAAGDRVIEYDANGNIEVL